jgi:hypothetical protein
MPILPAGKARETTVPGFGYELALQELKSDV